MIDFGVIPCFSFKIVHEDVIELSDEVPSSEDEKFVLLGQEGGQVATSGFGRVAFCLGFSPFEGVEVHFVEIVEGGPLVVDSSVASEDDDFVLVVGHGVVGSGLGPSDFAHGVFGWALRFLVGGLVPLEGGELEVEAVVVAFVGGVAAPEDEHPVLADLACGVEGSTVGDVPRADLVGPLAGGVVDDPEGVELVLGEEILGVVVLFGHLESAEQVVHFANRDDGVT